MAVKKGFRITVPITEYYTLEIEAETKEEALSLADRMSCIEVISKAIAITSHLGQAELE